MKLSSQKENPYELIERLVRENLELDFEVEHPISVFAGNSEESQPNSITTGVVVAQSNPDIDYINALCTQIQQKIDAIQQISGNLSTNINCESIIKGAISTLMSMETQCETILGDLNATSNEQNNLAINGQAIQGYVLDGGDNFVK